MKNQNTYHLVANGPLAHVPDLTIYKQDHDITWIGIDGGNRTLDHYQITPRVVFGDFDSIPNKLLKKLKLKVKEIYQYPTEKKETDFQIALNYLLNQKIFMIRVFGWSGGRLDQYLSNLVTLANPKYHEIISKTIFIDKQNFVQFFLPGEWIVTQNTKMKYVGFLTLTPVKNLSIKDGFKYQTKNWSFDKMTCLSSNEFTLASGEFSFDSGVIALIQSKDLI